MTYAVSAVLQTAIYNHLVSDADLSELVGADIYDAVPTGAVPALYVSLGPEIVFSAGDKTGSAARHRFIISVVSESGGFQLAKTVAGAVSDALLDARPEMERGRIVHINFVKASARRIGTGNKRRIDLRFEALVEDD